MEEKLNWFLMLPLREIALRRIAVVLTNRPEFLVAIDRLPLSEFVSNQWIGPLMNANQRTISELPLPSSLQKEMMPVLKAVASEIFRWKFINSKYLGKSSGHFEKLCWTTAGAIDYPKTAETLVGSDAIGIEGRFDLACLYCIEDYIPALWNELPRWRRETYNFRTQPSRNDEPDLKLIVPYIFKTSPRPDLFSPTYFRRDHHKYSEEVVNKPAAEYCLNRLSEEEREAVLFEVTLGSIFMYFTKGKKFQRPEIISYLLSLLTFEEQLRIFKRRPCQVVACFLDWPWQDLCLDIADVVWTFLDESMYEELLLAIKLHIDSIGYYLPDFIQEFFLRSPKKFQKYLFDQECEDVFFFNKFFCAEDSQSMQVIFRNIGIIDKERLLISEKFLKLFDNFLLSEKWHIVGECIQKAMLSKEYKEKLKEAFEIFLSEFRDFGIKSDLKRETKRKRFFHLLDERTSTTEKEGLESETLDQIKKLCIGEEKKVLQMN